MRNNGGKVILLAIYIDDGLLAADSEADVSGLLMFLRKHFEIKVFDAAHFRGHEIKKSSDGSKHAGKGL